MNRLFTTTIAALVAWGALFALPAFAVTAPGLAMAVAFSPVPARQGNETITVTLQDTRHQPVSNADVSIATSMPAMSMSGPTIKARLSRAGVYVAKINLNVATQWNFQVRAAAGRQNIQRSYTQSVK